MKCRLITDMWDDHNVEYIVHGYVRGMNTTGVTLELEYPDGSFVTRVVAYHKIEWIPDES